MGRIEYSDHGEHMKKLGENDHVLIQLVMGGSLTVGDEDKITYTANGLLIEGADDHRTMTYIPYSAIVFIRTYTKTARRKVMDRAAEKWADDQQELFSSDTSED